MCTQKRFVLGLSALGLPATAQPGPIAAVPADSVRCWGPHLRAGLGANEPLLPKNCKRGGTHSLARACASAARPATGGATATGRVGQFSPRRPVRPGRGRGGGRKTNDRPCLDTKHGSDPAKKWGLPTALNLLSQFAPGYSYANGGTAKLSSNFLAPGYPASSFGAEPRPSRRFNQRLAPRAPRGPNADPKARYVLCAGWPILRTAAASPLRPRPTLGSARAWAALRATTTTRTKASSPVKPVAGPCVRPQPPGQPAQE